MHKPATTPPRPPPRRRQPSFSLNGLTDAAPLMEPPTCTFALTSSSNAPAHHPPSIRRCLPSMKFPSLLLLLPPLQQICNCVRLTCSRNLLPQPTLCIAPILHDIFHITGHPRGRSAALLNSNTSDGATAPRYADRNTTSIFAGCTYLLNRLALTEASLIPNFRLTFAQFTTPLLIDLRMHAAHASLRGSH